MEEGLSILIPVYNHVCLPLATTLSRQIDGIGGAYACEVLFMDDGSNDERCKYANKGIRHFPHCQYVEQPVNVGRAMIRNTLAQEARYNHLLYLDCDVCVTNDHFIANWLEHLDDANVIVGSLTFDDGNGLYLHYLKYRYERHYLSRHSVQRRNMHPYKAFRTTHFMIRREVMLKFPFDGSFHEYGYEDTLFGKILEENGITLLHINDDVSIDNYEDNATFVRKTEESLRTLAAHAVQLEGYSSLLALYGVLHRWRVDSFVTAILTSTKSVMLRNIQGHHPSVFLFNIYKLYYFMSIVKDF